MKFFKLVLPLAVLAGSILLGKYLISTGPEARKKPFVERLPVVEVASLKAQDYTVTVKASGIVRAGIRTNLISEVSGRVLAISEGFKEGSYFNKNETLLKIDPSNYETALAIAESDVAANKASLDQLLEEEKSTRRSYRLAKTNLKIGRAEVARLTRLLKQKVITRSALDAEQQKLNQLQQRLEEAQGKLNTFKSRKLAIQAKINASISRKKQEALNLSHTMVKAPYRGRVLKKNIDIGQFITKGSNLGTIVATDYVYVDLPVSLSQYELLGIPEAFQNKTNQSATLPTVTFTSTNSRLKSSWVGKVVRTSAALDAESRQIKVIARIDSPFIEKEGVTAPVRIGQYLNAQIKGITFKNVYVIDTSAVRQNKEILLLNKGQVHIVPVDVLLNTSRHTIVKLKEQPESRQLITTPLKQATEGMKVLTLEQERLRQKNKEIIKNKSKKTDKEKEQSAGYYVSILNRVVS